MKDSGNDSLSSLTDGYLNTLDTVRNSNVLDTRCFCFPRAKLPIPTVVDTGGGAPVEEGHGVGLGVTYEGVIAALVINCYSTMVPMTLRYFVVDE